MASVLVFHQDAADKLKTVPASLKEGIEEAFEKLASDPDRVARKAVSPPHCWIGQVFHFKLRYKGGVHYFTVFFLFDDDPASKRLHVHDIVFTPSFDE